MSELNGMHASAKLAARSALGTTDASSPRLVFEADGLRILEEPLLTVLSLRSSRLGNHAGTAPSLSAWQLEAPQAANGLSGTADCGCAWVEPQCWIVVSRQATSAIAPDVLQTDVSDRYAAFRLIGPAASTVVSAGCDPSMVPVGKGARTRFAGMATALIQQWSDTDIRILVDVSIGEVFADWLCQTAGHLIARN